MVILLMVLLFLGVVAIDLLVEHRRLTALTTEGEALHRALENTEPRWVAGFQLPATLNYHRGHAWVHWVTPQQAYVGLDDFARRLIGSGASITSLPAGTQVAQGEGVIRIRRNGDEVRVVSPVSGEIISVNDKLRQDERIVHRDNYGQGWIFKIQSPRLFKELPNLLNGKLAERWMEDTRDRFQHQLMLATGSVIQDGGASIEDIGSSLTREEWRALVGEFLGGEPISSGGR